MTNRALRRKHAERMKRRARKLYAGTKCPEKFAEHLAVCSCNMCGNPRKHPWHEVTLQERKFYGRRRAEAGQEL